MSGEEYGEGTVARRNVLEGFGHEVCGNGWVLNCAESQWNSIESLRIGKVMNGSV